MGWYGCGSNYWLPNWRDSDDTWPILRVHCYFFFPHTQCVWWKLLDKTSPTDFRHSAEVLSSAPCVAEYGHPMTRWVQTNHKTRRDAIHNAIATFTHRYVKTYNRIIWTYTCIIKIIILCTLNKMCVCIYIHTYTLYPRSFSSHILSSNSSSPCIDMEHYTWSYMYINIAYEHYTIYMCIYIYIIGMFIFKTCSATS